MSPQRFYLVLSGLLGFAFGIVAALGVAAISGQQYGELVDQRERLLSECRALKATVGGLERKLAAVKISEKTDLHQVEVAAGEPGEAEAKIHIEDAVGRRTQTQGASAKYADPFDDPAVWKVTEGRGRSVDMNRVTTAERAARLSDDGFAVYRHPTMEIRERNYEDGYPREWFYAIPYLGTWVRDGCGYQWQQDGSSQRVYWKNGVPTGSWVYYDSSGKVVKVEDYWMPHRGPGQAGELMHTWWYDQEGNIRR